MTPWPRIKLSVKDHLDLTVSAPPINTRTSQDRYEAALFLLPKAGSQANGSLCCDAIEVPILERVAQLMNRQRMFSTCALAELWRHSVHGFQYPGRREGISNEPRHVCTHWSLLKALMSIDQYQDQVCSRLPVYGLFSHQDSISRSKTWKSSLSHTINQVRFKWTTKVMHTKWPRWRFFALIAIVVHRLLIFI